MARSRRSPAPNPRDELVQLALDLGLASMAEALPTILDQAEKQGMSFTDFALALLRTESNARKERRLQRSLRRSHLGTVEGLDGFDWSWRPQLEPRVVKELLGCRWVDEHRNVICIGKPGLGKTRVAKALTHAACIAGYSIQSVIMAEMLDDIHASLADGTYRRTFRKYTKPEVLLIDEFAYESVNAEATTHLFRVISARYQKTATVLTANVGFSKWKTLFPSEVQAVAAVDRLLHDATILRFTGKSWRGPRDIVGAPLDD